jgi:hypothetical protein
MNQLNKLLLLLFCFAYTSVLAQPGAPAQVNIINFTVKQKLPADVSTWNTVPAGLILVAKYMGQGNVQGTKLVLQIKKGGSRICGNNISTANMLDPFSTRNFNANELTGAFTQCPKLAAGNYTLCAQFFGENRKEISAEACREFIVEDAVQVQESYSPPQNITPGNGKIFKAEELKGPVTFRWTPLVPKPQQPVTYRLKVWQLMQGQTGVQAMRSNTPVVEKEVNNITQAVVTNIYTGPCKPPYLCDFVWQVQALNKEGKPMGSGNGMSELWSFAVSQYIIQLDSIKVKCTAQAGVYSFSYTITNPNAGPATLNLFTVTSSVPAGAVISSFLPAIGTTINAGNQLTITGTITAAPNLSNICIGAEIKDVGNAFWKASKDTCVNVVPCRCDACDEKNFTLTAPPPTPINFANNILAFTQPLTIVSVKPIKNIKAELVYFEMIPENDFCIPCNKDAATYGHFTNGTNSMQWIATTPPTPLNISITTPQMTPCCSAVFKWCIRYKIEFKDCTTCNKLVCYEKKKEGCERTTNPTK